MNYTHLGRTGLKVSRLCLGTMNFGDVTDEKTSARILDEALEAGINFIDTADVYGTEQSPDIQQGSGLSEEIIGRWLQQGGRRERIVLATSGSTAPIGGITCHASSPMPWPKTWCCLNSRSRGPVAKTPLRFSSRWPG
ncbi:hypothetical protein NUBL13797_01780 [Klebsiella pneumoniae]|nr:hypothetical protein NUBL13797_01780 [Klebsiella pneumoniae]